MLQVIQESWNLRFQLLQEVRVIAFQRHYLAHPITCLSGINDNWEKLIIGAQNELGEEIHFLSVLAFALLKY